MKTAASDIRSVTPAKRWVPVSLVFKRMVSFERIETVVTEVRALRGVMRLECVKHGAVSRETARVFYLQLKLESADKILVYVRGSYPDIESLEIVPDTPRPVAAKET